MQIKLTPDPSLFAIMVIFILNYLVVRRFFLKPVVEILEARETEVRTAEQLYEQSLARFNEAAAEMEKELHAARREAAQRREKFRTEALGYRNQVVDRTQTEAQKLVTDADQKLSGDVVVARETIKRDSENLARLAAERILGRSL